MASYLDMDWIEIKTELLLEGMPEAEKIINSNPKYSNIRKFSVHAAYHNFDLVNITPKQISRHEKDLDFARAIGSDRVIFHVGYSYDLGVKESLRKVIPVFEHYLDYSSGTDIQVLVENTKQNPNKLCSDPKQLRHILKSIDNERIGATLDIINLLEIKEKKQKDRYKRIKEWVRHIHLNSTPVYSGEFKMKKFVKYFLKDLKLKKKLKKKKEEKYNIPVILEGKTSLAREMHLYNDIKRKLD